MPLDMRMQNHKWRMLAATAAALIFYSAPYGVYRFVYPEAVLIYVGGHVIRPSFVASAAAATQGRCQLTRRQAMRPSSQSGV